MLVLMVFSEIAGGKELHNGEFQPRGGFNIWIVWRDSIYLKVLKRVDSSDWRRFWTAEIHETTTMYEMKGTTMYEIGTAPERKSQQLLYPIPQWHIKQLAQPNSPRPFATRLWQ
ncbi:hypothetical protein CDAR_115171 [Caerostris darwini]|uniref:Uncharacterized protein n=1 Tax=Caerostris darwini TaxID=1538125 RepID=A0AAV4RL30_9ARAC|nr:hypothetical protein CDAR_115171 [Caerostris darwini]